MFYRVTAELYFTEQDEANDFYHDCEVALPKSQIINPGQPNQETPRIRLHECFHDQTEPKVCIVLKEDTLPVP